MLPSSRLVNFGVCQLQTQRTQRRETIYGRFLSSNVYVELKGLKLSTIGDSANFQNCCDGYYSQWRSANKRGSNLHIKELDVLLTKDIFEDTPPELSLEKLRQEHRYFHESTSGQLPPLDKQGRRVRRNTENPTCQLFSED